MKYFKVKFGYGADDYITIDETELEKALRAQGMGLVAVFNGGSIAGNSIISILPDWNKVMGWNRDYQLTGEDYTAIGQKRESEYRDLLETTRMNVAQLAEKDTPKQIGTEKKKGKFKYEPVEKDGKIVMKEIPL